MPGMTPRAFRFVRAALTVPAWAAAISAHAVVGGTLDPNTNLTFAGVASLTSANGGTFSAVLIDRQYALTAAHVVAGSSAATWTVNLNAGGASTSEIGVRAITVAPGYAGFVPDADGLVRNDLAILRLAEPVPAGVPLYSIAPLSASASLTFVGYGSSGPFGAALAAPDRGAKYVGTNVADLLPSAPISDVFAFDVDAGSSDATLASGDSGSPSFVNVNGEWRLAGINTFVFTAAIPDGTRLSGGGGMVLSAYEPWIAAVTAVPEPSRYAMFLAGLGLAGFIARRRAR
jgi:secreted trypsin-like serine protease